jgi:hypothetical protein
MVHVMLLVEYVCGENERIGPRVCGKKQISFSTMPVRIALVGISE